MAAPDPARRTRKTSPQGPDPDGRMPPLGWIAVAGLLVVLAFVYSSWRGVELAASGEATAPAASGPAAAGG
jgi:hypothetical protein